MTTVRNSPGNPERVQLKRKLRKRRRMIKLIAKISWLLLLAASIGIYLVISHFGLDKGSLRTIRIVLIILNLLLAVFAWLPSIRNSGKVLQSGLCLFLAAVMLFGIIDIPLLRKVVVRVPDEGTLNINAYVLADNSELAGVENLAGKLVGIQKQLDSNNQIFAIKTINKEIQGEDIQTREFEDMYSSIDALYRGEIDCILLNEEYVNILTDIDDYKDFESRTRIVYSCPIHIDLPIDTKVIENLTKEPFVVGVIGSDDWNISGIDAVKGYRSDVNILVFVNPNTKQILMITIPRDAYVPLYGDRNMMDKLTHAPVNKGVQGWIDTVSSYFGIDINYYLRVNFSSLIDIVDGLGGIEIDNPYAFTTDVLFDHFRNPEKKSGTEYTSYHYEEGQIKLNGQQALAYCRERHNVQGGDMGRNRHQAIVMKAIINKICSVAIITKASDLLKALEGKFASNISLGREVTALVKYQLDGMYDWDLQSYSLSGTSAMAPSALAGKNKELSMVMVSETSYNTAKKYISQLMAGEIIDVNK